MKALERQMLVMGLFLTLLHDYVQESSLQELWRSVLYIVESKHKIVGKIVLLAWTAGK